MSLWNPIRSFYARFERPISSLSLILGFVFDAITLKRVDTLWENIWILTHLVVVGVFIVLIHTHESSDGDEKDSTKAHFWYVNILQFFFGGLLSTYLVLYFRSADIFVTWPFILILLGAFVANESLKRHYVRLSFQVSLFFLSIYSFTIFLVPVLMHAIGTRVFLISGAISLVLISVFLVFLFKITKESFTESKRTMASLILGIFALVNLLYFTNLIPPIPLSLKDGGVYHLVQRSQNGNYYVTSEKQSWRESLKLYPDFTKVEGKNVYVYSAIFSPKNLNLSVVHEWQHLNEVSNEWETEVIVHLSVVGGRDDGFRTYSKRSNLDLGKWRVNIRTENKKSIGLVRFNVIDSTVAPTLVRETKE